MEQATISGHRSRGRPRSFDIDEAVDRAVAVFCDRGYHATSIGDLTRAMDLAAGSVYKAFKDKRAVFLAALERYKAARDQALARRIADAATGRDRLRAALEFYAEASADEAGRHGCLVAGSVAGLATLDEELAAIVAEALKRVERRLAGLIEEGRADGSIPPGVDGPATARLMLCLVQGMRLVGKTGRSGPEMLRVADLAMALVA